MAKVSTQVARKDYPEKGIKKGDTYYSWALYKQPKQMSLTRPRPSQLTSSDKLSRAYAIVESVEDMQATATVPNDLVEALKNAATDARDLADEYQESLDNMPEGLQQGPTGEEIQQKVDALNEYADECESAASEIEQLDVQDYIDRDRFEDEATIELAELGNTSPTEEAIETVVLRLAAAITEFEELTESERRDMLQAAEELANVNLEI